MKRTIAFLLTAIMLLGMIPLASAEAGMDNFQKSQTYSAGQFADVKASDWFASGVQSAFELGLMKGSSDTVFKPTGNLTVAEALAIACRLHSIYADNKQEFTQGNPWYQVYVDYAVANKIMTAGQLNPTAQITREQFAYLMCGAIPEADLNAINTITEIPDEKADSTYGSFVFRLYNAGVLTGSDKYGTFKPTTAIQRSEVATIVTRMADNAQRIKFTPEKAVRDIQLSGKTSFMVGESVAWTATAVPEDANTQFIWKSSNTDVATVDQTGIVTAKSAGESDITVTAENGVKKTAKVTVDRGGTLQNPYPADGSVFITNQSYSSAPVRTYKIKCTNVITGDAASELVLSENQFNEINDDQEWRFYEFEVNYLSSSKGADDEMTGWDLIHYSLFYTTSGRSVASDYATLGKKYGAYGISKVKLYPGANGKIAIAIPVPKGTGDLLLKVENKDGSTWLKCVTVSDNNTATSSQATAVPAGVNVQKLSYSKLAEIVNSYVSENSLGMGNYCEYYNGYKDGYKIKYVVHKANTEKNHVVLQYYLENSSKQKIQGEIRFLNNEKGGYNIEWSGVFLDMDTKTLGSLFFNTGIDPALYDGKSKNGLDFKITSGSVTEINAQAAILKNSLTASKQLFSEFHNNVLKPAGYSIADLGFVKIF